VRSQLEFRKVEKLEKYSPVDGVKKGVKAHQIRGLPSMQQ
jgi:hypothetical protein